MVEVQGGLCNKNVSLTSERQPRETAIAEKFGILLNKPDNQFK